MNVLVSALCLRLHVRDPWCIPSMLAVQTHVPWDGCVVVSIDVAALDLVFCSPPQPIVCQSTPVFASLSLLLHGQRRSHPR